MRAIVFRVLAVVAMVLWTRSALADNPELIHQVDTVEIRRDGERLVVVATGQVNTGGFTNPRLEPAGPVADGVASFDFLVDPPTSPFVTMAFVTHEASAPLPPDREGIAAVRVRGAFGSVLVELP